MHGVKKIRKIAFDTERKGVESVKLNDVFGITEEEVNIEGAETHKKMMKIERLIRKGKKGFVGTAIDIFERILNMEYTPEQLLRMTLVVSIIRQSAREETITSLAKEAGDSLPLPEIPDVQKKDEESKVGYA